MSKKYLSKEAALKKLQHYCAYQDRCHSEVRSKLLDLGVYGDTLEEIMAELIGEKFLDEERFARSYARGKFRLKKWGRHRILRELKLRKISTYCVKKAMEEIDDDEYRGYLYEILIKKQLDYRRKYDNYLARQKAVQYAQQRGYELGLAWQLAKEIGDELTFDE